MLTGENLAYWYLRLNGVLQITNFIVHPRTRGSQRTDADIVGVRFPFRQERLFDDPSEVMKDDARITDLHLDEKPIVMIAEIKSGPCRINGPWTEKTKKNVHRVLSSFGFVDSKEIGSVADQLYSEGRAETQRLSFVSCLFGSRKSEDICRTLTGAQQFEWDSVAKWCIDRMRDYSRQKSQHEQWDEGGKQLYKIANCDIAEVRQQSVIATFGVQSKR